MQEESCSRIIEHTKNQNQRKQIMTVSLFQQRHSILLLNNSGAEYIRCGDLDAAIQTLGDALSEVKQCARMEEEQEEQAKADESGGGWTTRSCYGVDGEEEMDLTEWFSDILELMTTTMEQQMKQQNTSELQQQQEQQQQQIIMTTTSGMLACHHLQPVAHNNYCGGYVYSYPIELPIDDDIAIILKVQCVTIMFNLAMAFHLLGLKNSSSSQMYHHRQSDKDDNNNNNNNSAVRVWAFENAIAMYELCYEMMGSEQINPGLQFIMSLTNNLGHAHAMLHSFEKAKICWQQLLSIQMFLVDSSETATTAATEETTTTTIPTVGGGAAADSSSDNDTSNHRRFVSPWEGFFDNTSSLILNNICASAA